MSDAAPPSHKKAPSGVFLWDRTDVGNDPTEGVHKMAGAILDEAGPFATRTCQRRFEQREDEALCAELFPPLYRIKAFLAF